MIAWGDAQYGGDIHPWTAAELHDVAGLTTTGAFAAHRRDKSVVAWGDARYGGDAGRVVPGVAKVYSNDVAFAAVLEAGGVATWGAKGAGGAIPNDVEAKLAAQDVDIIFSNEFAFAARLADGSVEAWGYGPGGGTIPPAVVNMLSGFPVERVYASRQAFAAKTFLGSVSVWGAAEAGGDLGELDNNGDGTLNNNDLGSRTVVAVAASHYAFAATLNTGAVVAWGDDKAGGAIPAPSTSWARSSKSSPPQRLLRAAPTARSRRGARRPPAARVEVTTFLASVNGLKVTQVVATDYAFAAVLGRRRRHVGRRPLAAPPPTAPPPARRRRSWRARRAAASTSSSCTRLRCRSRRSSPTAPSSRGATPRAATRAIAAQLHDVKELVAAGSAFTAIRCGENTTARDERGSGGGAAAAGGRRRGGGGGGCGEGGVGAESLWRRLSYVLTNPELEHPSGRSHALAESHARRGVRSEQGLAAVGVRVLCAVRIVVVAAADPLGLRLQPLQKRSRLQQPAAFAPCFALAP